MTQLTLSRQWNVDDYRTDEGRPMWHVLTWARTDAHTAHAPPAQCAQRTNPSVHRTPHLRTPHTPHQAVLSAVSTLQPTVHPPSPNPLCDAQGHQSNQSGFDVIARPHSPAKAADPSPLSHPICPLSLPLPQNP